MKTPAIYKEMEFRGILIELARLMKPEVYVELGVKNCYTFNVMSLLSGKAIAVDIIDSKGYIKRSNTDFYVMTSEQFSLVNREKIDFLFIDADHKCESVLNDIARMTRFLLPYKSLVFLHDTYPTCIELLEQGYCYDAWKAANFVRRELKSDFEIVTIPGPWAGLSILRYAPKHLHGWMDANA